MSLIVDPDRREAEVLTRLVSFRGKDVLDVGCGEGRTARQIARTAASVVGVDSDPERVAWPGPTVRRSVRAESTTASRTQ